MKYATQADLIERIGRDSLIVLTDRTGSGEIDTVTVERAITDAEAEIDAAIAARYQLPLPSVPVFLRRLACDMAIYLMCQDAGTLTEDRRKRYEDARKSLQLLSKGEIKLGLPAAQEPTSNPEPFIREGRQDFQRFRL